MSSLVSIRLVDVYTDAPIAGKLGTQDGLLAVWDGRRLRVPAAHGKVAFGKCVRVEALTDDDTRLAPDLWCKTDKAFRIAVMRALTFENFTPDMDVCTEPDDVTRMLEEMVAPVESPSLEEVCANYYVFVKGNEGVPVESKIPLETSDGTGDLKRSLTMYRCKQGGWILAHLFYFKLNEGLLDLVHRMLNMVFPYDLGDLKDNVEPCKKAQVGTDGVKMCPLRCKDVLWPSERGMLRMR